MAKEINKKSKAAAGRKISRPNFGIEGNQAINWITVAVLIILAVWAYFVFDFLNKTYVTIRGTGSAQRQAQNVRIDVKQAQQTANEIEQGKLY